MCGTIRMYNANHRDKRLSHDPTKARRACCKWADTKVATLGSLENSDSTVELRGVRSYFDIENYD